MFKNSIKIIILIVLALATVNCERASTETSQVALKLPTYNNETALSCTKCLKKIIVNVDSSDFKTIVYHSGLDKLSEPATEINSEVNLEIPSGPARRIQIMAIYRLADSTIEMQYGSTSADLLSADPPPITISLANLGQFKGGSIVGRYLTGADSGPTGGIIVSVNHAASGLNMDIARAEMLNGWFDFFSSENFPMSYRFELGDIKLPGFQDITLNNIMPLTGGTYEDRFLRIHRPNTYYTYQNANWNLVNEYHDIVYGFFGLGSNLKRVCIENNPSIPFALSNLSSSVTGTPFLTFDESDVLGNIYGISGKNSGDPACVAFNSLTASRYQTGTISVNKDQFNGKGNDTAKSMGGAFTYIVSAGNVQKYLATGTAPRFYSFKALPGLFSSTNADPPLFDGVKLFKKSNAIHGGFDDFKCNDFWLAVAGFSLFDTYDAVPTIASDSINFSLPSAPAPTDGFIMCPTKGDKLIGLGGFYIGQLN